VWWLIVPSALIAVGAAVLAWKVPAVRGVALGVAGACAALIGFGLWLLGAKDTADAIRENWQARKSMRDTRSAGRRRAVEERRQADARGRAAQAVRDEQAGRDTAAEVADEFARRQRERDGR